jgi:REP element-mobilizing transposase RayT
MARLARHRSASGSLQPGSLYHVTNRGVDRMNIFHSDADRILFLSTLALLCEQHGLLVHAFCLMNNHFHLLLEDPRGLLGQSMNLLQSLYARYFNASRSWRRTGHLFSDRYFSEVVSSRRYYDQLGAYILLNPLRVATPLASAPDAFTWSSALAATSPLSPPDFCQTLLARLGSVDAFLASLPRARSVEAETNRRARLEALCRGVWLTPDAVRCGRSCDQYRAYLAARVGLSRPEPEPVGASPDDPRRDDADHATASHTPQDACVQTEVPIRGGRQVGVELDAAYDAIERACERIVPQIGPDVEHTRAGAMVYALWRFTSASVERIAAQVRGGVEQIIQTLEEYRLRHRDDPAWASVLWRLEWSLRWRLGASPHRG